MDKEGQLNAAKIMIATTADDEGDGNKDDVAVTKRDGKNLPALTEAIEHDTAPTPDNNVTNTVPKAAVVPPASKGKDINERRLEIKSKSEVG